MFVCSQDTVEAALLGVFHDRTVVLTIQQVSVDSNRHRENQSQNACTFSQNILHFFGKEQTP